MFAKLSEELEIVSQNLLPESGGVYERSPVAPEFDSERELPSFDFNASQKSPQASFPFRTDSGHFSQSTCGPIPKGNQLRSKIDISVSQEVDLGKDHGQLNASRMAMVAEVAELFKRVPGRRISRPLSAPAAPINSKLDPILLNLNALANLRRKSCAKGTNLGLRIPSSPQISKSSSPLEAPRGTSNPMIRSSQSIPLISALAEPEILPQCGNAPSDTSADSPSITVGDSANVPLESSGSHGAGVCNDGISFSHQRKLSQSISTQTPTLDFLPPPDLVPQGLSSGVEEVLNAELWSVYKYLRPSDTEMNARFRFVEKLQKIFDSEWPSKHLLVYPFGYGITFSSSHPVYLFLLLRKHLLCVL
jgi:hypothetical protein